MSDVVAYTQEFVTENRGRYELGGMLAMDDLAVLAKIANQVRRHHREMAGLVTALSVGAASQYDELTAAAVEIDFLDALTPEAARIVRAQVEADQAELA